MKKTMKAIVSLTLVLALALSLAACGGKAPSGKYKLKSMTVEGQTMTAEDLYEAAGIEADMYVEFKEDGTGRMSAMGLESDFQWKDNVMTVDGEDQTFKVKGSKVILTNGDDEIVFEK